MGAADDAYNQINKKYYDWENGYDDNEVEESLKILKDLKDPKDFETVFNKLDDNERQGILAGVRKKNDGAADDRDYRIDPKYAQYTDIIRALEDGKPDAVVKQKQTEKDNAEEPQFADTPARKIPRESDIDHIYTVALPYPQGSSKSLQLLIDDTNFTMQWDIDTLGDRNPKAAPDFAKILDSDMITSPEGWSDVKKQYDTLKSDLEGRQTEYANKHKDVKGKTKDTELEGNEIFIALRGYAEELKKELGYNYKYFKDKYGDRLKRENDKITVTHTGEEAPYGSYTEDLYKKGDDGKFVLTDAAEQIHYVNAIDRTVDVWEAKYAEATKKFQDKAKEVDTSDDPPPEKKTEPTTTTTTTPTTTTTTPTTTTTTPTSTTTTPTSDTTGTGDEFDDIVSDVLGKDGSDTGSDALGTGDSSGLGTGGLGNVSDVSGTGTGTQGGAIGGGGATGGGAAPGAAGGGENPLGSLMSILPLLLSMGGGLGGLLGGGKKDDAEERKRDKEEAKKREQEAYDAGVAAAGGQTQQVVNGQPGSAQPGAAQATPAGVTAPNGAGNPPPVSAPGTKVDFPIRDGVTQSVPSTVAEALNRQLHGGAADANAAYQGTPGESSGDHRWTTVNDLTKLQTGDVVQWSNHNALIVVENGSLSYIDNGQLIPLDPQHPQNDAYGAFQGFRHPSGIGDGAGQDAAAPPPPGPGTPGHNGSPGNAVQAAATPPPITPALDPAASGPPKI
ncbi:hypothetical protein [Nocardia blacklockiae]|uniref:hypothetical protein n=1 Tax=Nocardia blacklockiae TaxID=480036 RepID=UPI00189310A5|nr:hypothetical protein [Nocardia blacklockiae]MBF6175648.1 hypothetical protein [Nocardia blacklockiae]